MALPQLTDEEVRTWTPEQKDRWWLENVFRGNMPQLTLRAMVTGFFLGGVLSATNLYIGAKTGWSLGVGVTSVILSFMLFRVFASVGFAKDMTILENNAVQSIATAAGYMTGPLISAIMAYMFIKNETLPWHQILIWNVMASLLGVLVAFPMKRRFINNEQQPFPEGRAVAVVLDSLYPHAPQGGTKNLADAASAAARRAADSVASAAAAAVGVFKAKSLLVAGLIGAFVNMLIAEGYQTLIQVQLLGLHKKAEEIWKLPERLDSWYYDLAISKGWWMPSIGGFQIQQLGVVPVIDLSMFGAGGLMGMRIANSLLLGCLINFLVIAPIMLNRGEIPPLPESALTNPNAARAFLVNSWCLWWGVAMMVTASLAGLFAKPKLLLSAFSGLMPRKSKTVDCLKDIEFPLWVSLVGVPLMTIVTVIVNYMFFRIDPWLGLLSIPLILVLTLIAANATALTSTTPTGALSKITQFTFGAIEPTSPATNLITAGMTTEVAGNASNLIMDIKPGYMLGAKPRQQAWGHCIGIVSGAIASTPLFFILFLGKWDPASGVTIEKHVTETANWPMPGALQWAAVARVIEGIGNTHAGDSIVQVVHGVKKLWGVMPVSAGWSMLVGAILAIVFEMARIVSKGKFPLSAVGIGLGVVIPPSSTLAMWAGAAFFAFMARRGERQEKTSFSHRFWFDSKEAICAGLVAGWALAGIGDALITTGAFFSLDGHPVSRRLTRVSRRPFKDTMTIRRAPEDFVVEERLTEAFRNRLVQTRDDAHPHATFELTKTSLTTPQAVGYLATEMRVAPRDASTAGLKDRHARTTQYVSLPLTRRAASAAARGGAGKDWRGRLIGWSDRPIDSSASEGNRFTIVVRGMNAASRALLGRRATLFSDRDALVVTNYFGDQRFGSARHGKGFAARHLIRGEFEPALKLLIATPARQDHGATRTLTETCAAHWGDWSGILASLPRMLEARSIGVLAEGGTFADAFAALPRFTQLMCVEAYQSHLWNEIARRMIRLWCPADRIVTVDDAYGAMHFAPSASIDHERQQTVLPLFGPATTFQEPWGTAGEETLRAEGIAAKELRIPGLRKPFFGEAPRSLFVRVARFSISDDDRGAVLRFDLPRGAYATVVLRALGQ